ncbi:hypothetical protein TW86_03685 [Halomonas sp. S2151]|uniref:thymidylate synthase n=1 Tax=Halomonas sp. S2151 TaxID=579478 RepID=UPI00061F4751|nr:thymidylate synthase [Halomonas sp. S2151]KJZ17368.1 hypothetical protein TW86_03685 [Halomonas sp. S2151]
MLTPDDIYLDTAEIIADEGIMKSDRTGTGTISVFGQQMAFDLTGDKLPLLTTKKLVLRSIIHELIWFLRGEGNIAYLKENGVGIWDSWADENGDLGPVYGVQWRHWQDTRIVSADQLDDLEKQGFTVIGEVSFGKYAVHREIDQIASILEQLRNNPDSRRMILTAWNPSVVEEQALPPCHTLVHFYSQELSPLQRRQIAKTRADIRKCAGHPISEAECALLNGDDVTDQQIAELVPATRGLSCHLYQRSGDFFLGVPFNIASYSLLTHMLAKLVGMEPMEFVHTIGDAHIYTNHVDQLAEQMKNEPKEEVPFVTLENAERYQDPAEYRFEDIQVHNYHHHQFIKAPVAV